MAAEPSPPTGAAPTDAVRRNAPGVLLALALALVAGLLADQLGPLVAAEGGANPVSPIPVAVVLGLLFGHTVGVPGRYGPGVELAVKHVLRAGVVLIGLKLSIVDVLEVGLIGVPVVIALSAFALAAALLLARLLGIGSRLGSLAAASTAICGITATLAVAPVIRADKNEVAYTVANVTLLGLFGMLVYPHVAHALFADQPGAAGLFLGTSIHDTSQVMGAALTYDQLFDSPRALQVATVAKLTRNALLVAVVPLMGWMHRVDGDAPRSKGGLFPTFVLGFLALAAVRSVGDLAVAAEVVPVGPWEQVIHLLGGRLSTLALATALAGVGLGTRLGSIAQLGARPLAVGTGAAAAVVAASLAIAAAIGPYLGG